MHPNEFAKKTIKVDSASNIVLETLYLDSEYQPPQIDPKRAAEPNGLLVLFSLQPTAGKDLPTFLGRWDFNKNTIDIDLEKGSTIDEDDFKGERNGCGGHHPLTIRAAPRVFGIDIRLPGRRIFEGTMTCTVDFCARHTASMSFNAELSVKLIRGEPKS